MMKKARQANTPKANRATTPPGFVKTSISLPKDLADFAEQQAQKIGKQDNEPANFSKYLRNLIKADKRAEGVAK